MNFEAPLHYVLSSGVDFLQLERGSLEVRGVSLQISLTYQLLSLSVALEMWDKTWIIADSQLLTRYLIPTWHEATDHG